MRLMRIGLSLAFTDAQQRTADSVASELARYAVDGQEAEVVHTTLKDQTDIVYPDVDYEAETSDADNDRWLEEAHNKLEELEQPATNSVTLTIDRNDLGQAIDGLRVRAEQYDDAVRHFNGEIVLSEIPECDDAEEAQAIAEHYRKIIAVMEAATQ